MPGSVSEARHYTRQTLARHGFAGDVDPVLLVMSELVTNAILHTGGAVSVSVHVEPDVVLLSVRDPAPDPPRPRQPDPSAVGGRGLQIVERVARQWGWEPVADGKVVWCEIPTWRP